MADNSCAKCGACTSVCPVYQVTGQESLTARGRLHLLEKITEAKHSEAYLDIFSKCLLCDACHQVCPRNINLPVKVVETRQNFPQLFGQKAFVRSLVKSCLSHQKILAGIGKFLKISTALLDKLPVNSGLRLKLDLPETKEHVRTPKKNLRPDEISTYSPAKSMLFPGCFAQHLNPEITSATIKLIAKGEHGSPDIPKGQTCCGLAFYSSGNIGQARQQARLNINAFGATDLPIIVACGSCYSHLANYPTLLANDSEWHPQALAFASRLRELSSFLNTQPFSSNNAIGEPNQLAKTRVIYHAPCHLRYKPETGNAARHMLNSLPQVELVELPNGSQCCGFGGLFNLAHLDISEQISGKLIGNILSANPDLIVTTCSGCLIQLRQQLATSRSHTKVHHLSQVLTEMIE